MPTLLNKNILTNFTQRKKSPNTEFFLFSIFLHSDQTKLHIWTLLRTKKTPYLDIFYAVSVYRQIT